MHKHENYYWSTVNKALDFPALPEHVTADICIVGAGFTGLGTALELAAKGYKVVVLEAEYVGYGASGRSGGQVASGYSCGMMETADIVGNADAAKLWEFSEMAKEILHNRLAQFNIECDYRDGEYYAAPRHSHLKWLQKEMSFVEDSYGYEKYRWIDLDEMREVMAGNRYMGALLDLEGGHLNPLNYVVGMADAAACLSARIFENSKVLSYRTDTAGGKVEVLTEHGKVTASSIVLAGNAYMRNLATPLERRMIPARSSILATEPLGKDRAWELLKSSACVADTNFDLDYFKFTPDNRLVYGGQDLSFGDSTKQNNSVRSSMLKTFPMLKDVKVDYFWSGELSITRKRLPDIGKLSNNVYYAQGYSGQGVPLSAIVSRILADAINGDMTRFDVFARIPHSYIPRSRLLQVPLYYTVLLWNRLKDLL